MDSQFIHRVGSCMIVKAVFWLYCALCCKLRMHDLLVAFRYKGKFSKKD